MPLQYSQVQFHALAKLMLASGTLYAATRTAIFVLARPDGANPGRRAVGQWLSIAGVTLAAVFFDRSDIALSLIFGTSVACLALAGGMLTWLTPMTTLPPSRKSWPLVFPATLLVLMAGLSSHLDWRHAVMLLLLGAAIWAVWVDAPERTAGVGQSDTDRSLPRTALLLLLAIVLVGVGAYFAVRGTLAACSSRDASGRMLQPGTLAATILSPLLVLPTLAASSTVASRGEVGRALSALVGTVLLNLCLLLPVTILLWALHPAAWTVDARRFFSIRWDAGRAVPFDLPVWQIETVCLLVLGFGLIPVALGKWMLSRIESTFLLLGYAAYLLALALFGVLQL